MSVEMDNAMTAKSVNCFCCLALLCSEKAPKGLVVCEEVV